MDQPDPALERKILQDLVDQMEDPQATLRKQGVLRRALLSASAVGATAVFLLALNDLTHPLVTALAAALLGTLAGFAVFLEFARKQWPVTTRYIDMESVRRRLAELDRQAAEGP